MPDKTLFWILQTWRAWQVLFPPSTYRRQVDQSKQNQSKCNKKISGLFYKTISFEVEECCVYNKNCEGAWKKGLQWDLKSWPPTNWFDGNWIFALKNFGLTYRSVYFGHIRPIFPEWEKILERLRFQTSKHNKYLRKVTLQLYKKTTTTTNNKWKLNLISQRDSVAWPPPPPCYPMGG